MPVSTTRDLLYCKVTSFGSQHTLNSYTEVQKKGPFCKFIFLSWCFLLPITVSKMHFLLFSLFLTRLSLQQRQQAIGLLLSGQSIVFVANFFGVCRKTIRKLRDRYQISGSVDDNSRSGRPGLSNNEGRSIMVWWPEDLKKTSFQMSYIEENA